MNLQDGKYLSPIYYSQTHSNATLRSLCTWVIMTSGNAEILSMVQLTREIDLAYRLLPFPISSSPTIHLFTSAKHLFIQASHKRYRKDGFHSLKPYFDSISEY